MYACFHIYICITTFVVTTSYLVINLYYLRFTNMKSLSAISSEIYLSRKRRVTLLRTFDIRNGTHLGPSSLWFAFVKLSRRNMPFAISTEMDYLGGTSPQARFANVPFEYSIASRSLDRSSRFTRVVRLLAQQENLFTSGQKCCKSH